MSRNLLGPSRLLLIVPTLFLLAGCASRQPLTRTGWHLGDGTVHELWRKSEAEFHSVQNLKAEAKITYRREGETLKGRMGLLFKRPSVLHMEVIAPFFGPVFAAIIDEDSLTVLSGEEIFKGSSSGDLLQQLTGIDLDLGNAVYTVLGFTEPPLPTSSMNLEYPRADLVIANIDEPGRRRRVWIDLHRGFVRREEIFNGFDPVMTKELDNYKLVDGLHLPKLVSIHQGEATVVLEYKNYAISFQPESEPVGR